VAVIGLSDGLAAARRGGRLIGRIRLPRRAPQVQIVVFAATFHGLPENSKSLSNLLKHSRFERKQNSFFRIYD
jgi:hypothetical protein